jgi:hypothetical protein
VGDPPTPSEAGDPNQASGLGIRYIDEDVFIKHYPGAIAEEGSSYQLSMEEVNNLLHSVA